MGSVSALCHAAFGKCYVTHRNRIRMALMRDVAQWSLESWPDCGMYLWVLESNTPAIRFYERVGGRRAGEGLWNPPDGGEYRKLRYAWDDLPGFVHVGTPVG